MPRTFESESELVSFVISAKLPDWQRKLFIRYSEAVKVHSQGQLFYKLDRLFPNEHVESKEHRILSFESITEPSFGRAANNVNRIFKNSSYTVEASESVISMASSHSFDGMNLYSWFLENWVMYAMKTDPNSRIVIYPPTYRQDKIPVSFIKSEFIKYIDDETLIFVSEEESVVDYEMKESFIRDDVFFDPSINRMNVRESQQKTYTPRIEASVKRYVYHAFLKGVGFYRIEQLENSGKQYEIELFEVPFDFIPAIDAGGEKTINGINKSFLHPFVTFGNLALLQHSQHTAVNFTFSFPRMSEIATPCDVQGCQDGYIVCETEEDIAKYGDKKKCLNCINGFTTSQTPYKVYRKNYDPMSTDDTKFLEVDDVKYYTPDTSILDYSKNEWKNYLEMAETAVYINQRVATGNVESAKSKEIDREDMYSFLYRVGQCYFQRLRFVLQCFENYTVPNPVKVNVETPFSYAILSEGEAFAALKDILSSNVPVMLKASQVESFINKFVSQGSPIRVFLEVLKLVDPLLYYTSVEIASFKSNNVVSPEQYSVHVFSYPVLQNMFVNDKTLSLQPVEKIAELLKKELEAYKPKPVDDMKTAIIRQNQNDSGE